jgi:hypothetical protein
VIVNGDAFSWLQAMISVAGGPASGAEWSSGGMRTTAQLDHGRWARASARRAQSQYGITIVGEVATPLVYRCGAAVASM